MVSAGKEFVTVYSMATICLFLFICFTLSETTYMFDILSHFIL
uniref:Uncharacterized protein n=1 Tax=Heterorhabditis bacteriophora TaxID=37862 RepID=A0A1I7WTS4_HETBA